MIEAGNCNPAETALDWVQSAAYETFLSVPFQPPVEITAVAPDPRQHVLTLELPPGSWHISTGFAADKSSRDGILDCATFTAPGFATSVEHASMGTGPGDIRHLTLAGVGTAEFSSGGQAKLRCRQRAGATGANPLIVLADITAIRTGVITSGVGS